MTPPVIPCERFAALLGDLMDGTLDAATADACGRHRTECRACAALEADVHAITAAAATLPPPALSPDLWGAIAARLEAPGVPVTSAGTSPSTSTSATTSASRPARGAWPWHRLAAAAALLVTVSAGATWMVARRARPDVAPTVLVAAGHAPAAELDSLYGREIALLRDAAEGSLGQLDSATAVVVRRNLAIIDQAIRESRAALAADPGSAFLLEQLDRAYGRKVGLLRRLTLL